MILDCVRQLLRHRQSGGESVREGREGERERKKEGPEAVFGLLPTASEYSSSQGRSPPSLLHLVLLLLLLLLVFSFLTPSLLVLFSLSLVRTYLHSAPFFLSGVLETC